MIARKVFSSKYLYKNLRYIIENIIIHPVFFSVYPLLSFFLHNINQLYLETLFIPLLTVTLLSIILFHILNFFIRNKQKSGITSSAFLLIFFTYGHITSAVKQSFLQKYHLDQHQYIFPSLIILFFIFFILIIKSKKTFSKITVFLNYFSILLILMLIGEISYVYVSRAFLPNSQISQADTITSSSTTNSEILPDIYYIVADRYASESSLKNYYNFDNSDFTSYLKEKGFYIADSSYSNYLTTSLSLASSLNLEYLDELAKKVGENNRNQLPLINLIQDNKVIKYLKNHGYKYFHIGGFWTNTSTNKYADINFQYNHKIYPASEFLAVFLQTTILQPFLTKLEITRDYDLRILHRTICLKQIDSLIEYSKLPGPKFIFAHLYLTHPPYVFDRNGNYVNTKEENAKGKIDSYVDQMYFANGRYKYIFDSILSNDKDAIIIFQADEGPYPAKYHFNEESFQGTKLGSDELKEKTGIMNAYYFPGIEKTDLYSSISPVNSFRLLFNLYFNENYPLLDDKIYANFDKNLVYKLTDVTVKVKDK